MPDYRRATERPPRPGRPPELCIEVHYKPGPDRAEWADVRWTGGAPPAETLVRVLEALTGMTEEGADHVVRSVHVAEHGTIRT